MGIQYSIKHPAMNVRLIIVLTFVLSASLSDALFLRLKDQCQTDLDCGGGENYCGFNILGWFRYCGNKIQDRLRKLKRLERRYRRDRRDRKRTEASFQRGKESLLSGPNGGYWAT